MYEKCATVKQTCSIPCHTHSMCLQFMADNVDYNIPVGKVKVFKNPIHSKPTKYALLPESMTRGVTTLTCYGNCLGYFDQGHHSGMKRCKWFMLDHTLKSQRQYFCQC
ncbi:hypothetical protein MAR_008080 [Mya arenaria]|uniref:Uncharacterized protein n=1 Tax=Mya arenaria TaxID=6604 RepID=A0ABY7DUX6_MYAAR|nr:hypothetical protein MAR_008080 [Mya arenaria]